MNRSGGGQTFAAYAGLVGQTLLTVGRVATDEFTSACRESRQLSFDVDTGARRYGAASQEGLLMLFEVRSSLPPEGTIYDEVTVVLERDNWDDFGFKTLFGVFVYVATNPRPIELGAAKFLSEDRLRGSTLLPDTFEQLPATFCSLGDSPSYYEAIAGLGPDLANTILAGLQDIATKPSQEGWWRSHPGFETSLLRNTSALEALAVASAIVAGRNLEGSQNQDFVLETKLGDEADGDVRVRFAFRPRGSLPGRINVLIGYNGSGKSALLSNLAWVANSRLSRRPQNDVIKGRFSSGEPDIGSVVAVSFSAFDVFDLPVSLMAQGFSYIGLRNYDKRTGLRDGLKGHAELTQDMKDAVLRINSPLRRQAYVDAAQVLRREPSLDLIDGVPDFLGDQNWEAKYNKLSTGHKIVLAIVVQLISVLERRSLVLLDEPETHLHPPLIAALMRAVHSVLDSQDSYAVVATHSPVVLQEVPSRFVRIVRRSGNTTDLGAPSIETFGENVGILTQEVFNLDNARGEYQAVLASLVESGLSLDQIEDLFSRGLSSQARSLLIQYGRRRIG